MLCYSCVQALGFTCVPTILLYRLPTIHEFSLLGLAVIGRQELLNVLLYLEGTFSHSFLRGKIILGHLAQRTLQSMGRDTGEKSPAANSTGSAHSPCQPHGLTVQQTYLQLCHLGYFSAVPLGRGAEKCYKNKALQESF